MSAGIEERGAVGIGELLQHRLGQRQSLLEPAPVKGRLVEGDQAVDQEGVVFEVGAELGPAVLVGAEQAAVAAEFARRKSAFRWPRLDNRLGRGRAILGERPQHQAVPGGDDFVVVPGRTRFARRRRASAARPR